MSCLIQGLVNSKLMLLGPLAFLYFVTMNQSDETTTVLEFLCQGQRIRYLLPLLSLLQSFRLALG